MVRRTKFMFKDDESWSAKEKEKVYRNFLASLKNRSLDNMTEKVYLWYHCYAGGFIAHYNRQGFASTYSGEAFLEFLQHWVNPKHAWLIDKRSDLNHAISQAAKAEYDTIVREFENRRLNAKLNMLRALADELGYKVIPKDADDSTPETPLYGVEANGQVWLIG
ncbi:hypothetical protein LLE49_27970 [Alicyclobacillus tolerans]|uniref:hypothetical protein n=1 Tax=Alicyclobacillus tolerans TaxID=90970 RepID=UPI001F30DEBA|nr:hypothetical protein [Alicyclobacillus tolerans]MCF8568561.1 hypothetical protein [Alicyclobacillus tolerans]